MYCPVYLRCDGYLVSAMLERVEKNRLAIAVAVNGWAFVGEWLPLDDREMSEEARRFWRPQRKAKMRAKELKLWERALAKRECRSRGYYDSRVWPTPLWLRPRPFVRHLKAHNDRIEIIDHAAYSQGLEALRVAQ
jgi:hypothetical protein